MIGNDRLPIALGEFTFSKEMQQPLAVQIDQLRILLEDDHARPGTLEGKTVAALMGNHLRAAHRDVHDTNSGLSGSFVDMGGPRGPKLRLTALGPLAPVMDVHDPRRGISRLMDSVAPSILAGVGGMGTEAQKRVWHLCAVLIVDRLVESGGAWGDWYDLEVAFPSTLSPLQVTSVRPGVVRQMASGLSELFEADHPANRAIGALKIKCFKPHESEAIHASMEPWVHHFENEDLPTIDAIERLRILAELETLLA